MLNSFCCMRLNTAGLVIGWIGAIGSFLSTSLLILAIVHIDTITKMLLEDMGNEHAKADEMRRFALVFIYLHFVNSLINLIASILLIIGTIKEKYWMLWPWLINSGIGILIHGTHIIIFIVAVVIDNLKIVPFLILLFVGFLTILFLLYVWFAIYSLYKQFKGDQ